MQIFALDATKEFGLKVATAIGLAEEKAASPGSFATST